MVLQTLALDILAATLGIQKHILPSRWKIESECQLGNIYKYEK